MDVDHTNIFAIEPKSILIPLEEEDVERTSIFHESYKVYNIGRTEVHVELLKGVCRGVEQVVEACTVNPGHTVTFDNVGKFFIVSAIRISNRTDVRALVHCTKTDGHYSLVEVRDPKTYDSDYVKKLWDTFSIGVKCIPYVNKKYEALLNALWPSGELNVWEKTLIKLKPLLNEVQLYPLVVELCSCVINIEQKLNDFLKGEHLYQIYRDIAEELSEFVQQFFKETYDNDKTANMLLLPLFSNFFLMTTIFYTLGLISASDIELTSIDVTRIQHQLNVTTKKATKYVNDMLTTCLDHSYDTAPLENLYNNMMNIRTYIGLHGLEYSNIWQSIVRNPYISSNTHNDIITYSNFFGRQTPNLIRQATCPKMYPPLTPLYIGFIYNYLTLIEVYLWTSNKQSSPKIGGMKLVFGDHSSYIMGTKTENVKEIDMTGVYISKLKVTGNGSIDSCIFFLSDGRELVFGTVEGNSEEVVFELKGHRIVSMFLSSDDVTLGGQAANIAVSYRLNSEWEQ